MESIIKVRRNNRNDNDNNNNKNNNGSLGCTLKAAKSFMGPLASQSAIKH